MLPAHGNGRNDVVDHLGDDDADRHLSIVRAIGGIERPAATVESDLAANRPLQFGLNAASVNIKHAFRHGTSRC